MWRTPRTVRVKLRPCQRRKLSSQPEGEAKPKTHPQSPTQPKAPLPEFKPPKKRSGILWKLLGFGIVSTGGIVTYSWYDPRFRRLVEDYVPYSKETFTAFFKYLPESSLSKEKQDSSVKPLQSSGPLMIGDTTSIKEEGKWKRPQAEVKQVPETEVAKSVTAPKSDPSPALAPVPAPTPAPAPASAPALSEKQKAKEEAERRLKQKQEEEAQENAALEVNLERLIELTAEKTKAAVDAQNIVIQTTKQHTELLKKAIDDTSQTQKIDSQWQDATKAYQARQDAVIAAEKVVMTAKQDVEKLKQVIEEGKKNQVTKRNKSLITAQENFNKFSNDLNKVATQVSKCESEAKVMSKYKNLVEKGKKQFKEELESIMPEIKIGDSRGKKMTEEELNSLIAHAHRRIEQLQKQLAEQIALEQHRMKEALEQQQKEDDKVADQKVADESEKLRNEFAVEKQRWDADAQVQFEIDLKRALVRQTAAHSENLKDVLKAQEEELEKKFEMQIQEKMLAERQAFQTEVAGWIARLKGIETAVEGRAELEKIARQAQELWLSCVALNGIIRLGKEGQESMEDQLKPLTNEIEAVSQASGNHPFVNTLISTLPEEAIVKGVWTEDNLKERFCKVNKLCRRVAMIDENGGSLFKYFLSYVQSIFIINTPFAKKETDEVDLDNLDTFTILSHAEYYIQNGDIEQALRFMNQLQGEPRQVASDWIDDTKIFLETRQAAHAMTAFASASGLGTVF